MTFNLFSMYELYYDIYISKKEMRTTGATVVFGPSVGFFLDFLWETKSGCF